MKILVVDDDPVDLRATELLLTRSGYEVDPCLSGAEAVAKVRVSPVSYGLAILDYRMGEMNGARTAEEILKIQREIFILMHSGDRTQGSVLSTWRAGAVTFIEKSDDSDLFLNTVTEWVSKYRENVERLVPQSPSENERVISRLGMVGCSDQIAHLAQLICSEQFSSSDTNVLIEGENGTGKELIARAIHENSRRRERPFIIVNCAAIPENLIESELFGFEKGAFTGAEKSKEGLFAHADGGTVFLDEIGEASLQFQAKILRLIQQKTFRPLGGHEEKNADVRIIAATNRNLMREVRERRFREDLYYRLAVVAFQVPPLRQRINDIEPIILWLVKKYNVAENQQKSFLKDAARALTRYSWPGNVRELENIIVRLLQFTPKDLIGVGDFDESLRLKVGPTAEEKETLREQVHRISRDSVLAALAASGSRRDAAKKLGMPWSTFRDLLRRLGIDQDATAEGHGK